VRRSSLFLGASISAFLWTNHAHAATTCVPTPLAPCPSDTIQITDANGNVINDTNGKPASAVINEGDPAESLASTINGVVFNLAVPPPSTTASTAVWLLEAAPDANGQAPGSDVVQTNPITLPSGPGTQIVFLSDAENQPPPIIPCNNSPLVRCVVETGFPQNVASLLFGVAAPPVQVIVQSDPAEVPEPGTFLLFSTGIAGLGALGVRRHRM
jgi:hypothetical protein